MDIRNFFFIIVFFFSLGVVSAQDSTSTSAPTSASIQLATVATTVATTVGFENAVEMQGYVHKTSWTTHMVPNQDIGISFFGSSNAFTVSAPGVEIWYENYQNGYSVLYKMQNFEAITVFVEEEEVVVIYNNDTKSYDLYHFDDNYDFVKKKPVDIDLQALFNDSLSEVDKYLKNNTSFFEEEQYQIGAKN